MMSLKIHRPPEETAALVKRAIVEAIEDAKVEVSGMGGHFDIESAPGKGTRAVFSVPLG